MPVQDLKSAAKDVERVFYGGDKRAGQSALWRRVGNRSSIWRSNHRNQCETEPSGRSPWGVPLYSTPILDPSSSLKRFSSVALVTRLIVIIGRFVSSRPQWNECSSSHFRESVNSGRVIAANTTENEGELNHHVSSSKPAIVRSFEGCFFGILSPRKRMIDEQ